MAIEQGEIYDFDFGPRPHGDRRIEGPHPVLIIQRDELNKLPGYALTVIVPITSKGRESYTYAKIEPDTGNGLAKTSWAKCEQVFTIRMEELPEEPRGRISGAVLHEVKERLRFLFAIG